MNLWFTFFVWFAWNVHASVVIISLSLATDRPNLMLNRTDISSSFQMQVVRREELKGKELQLFCLFFLLIIYFECVLSFGIFCKKKNRMDNLSLFVWFFVFFFIHRFATDLVCTMRFLFRMAFVYVIAIGSDFWGCRKHMDHRYVHFFSLSRSLLLLHLLVILSKLTVKQWEKYPKIF